MLRKIISYPLFLLILFSCTQVSKNHNSNTEIKDSAIKSYLNHADKLFKNKILFYDLDSNEQSYKMLKAYYLNDTTYLKQVIKSIGNAENFNSDLDTFWKANIPILKNLNIEEGYQFQYSQTFCNNYYILTISKFKDVVRLNTFIYKPTLAFNNSPVQFQMVKNYSKVLSITNWNELLDALYLADYWNLKPHNNDVVLDPTSLSVLGIKRDVQNNEITKTNSVERTLFKNTALYKAFLLALKFAEIEKVCGG